MRGRAGKVPPAGADLLVCFPSRAHLSLMPKPICSPARPAEPAALHRRRRRSGVRIGGGNGYGSPLMWAKSKTQNAEISEPTSPKVTCAGQIKVRAKPRSCKNWQSVMEEIERMHNNRKKKRRSGWIESLGFKKEVMQFLTCLRSLRFDFRCFGSFPSGGVTSDDDEDGDGDDDDEDEDEEEEENRRSKGENDRDSNAVFSKWYMILQENNHGEEFGDKGKMTTPCLADDGDGDSGDAAPTAPPPNALLLMRCRSAPAKNWPEEAKHEQKEDEAAAEEQEQLETAAMKSSEDFLNISEDIAEETWIVGGIRDMLSRSRSWKR